MGRAGYPFPEVNLPELTASEFKTRHASHKTSMRHEHYANSTEPSKYIWQLSNRQTRYSLSWTILERARPYSNACKRRNLWIAEAYHILHADKDMALNKRSELVSTCRHQKNVHPRCQRCEISKTFQFLITGPCYVYLGVFCYRFCL